MKAFNLKEIDLDLLKSQRDHLLTLSVEEYCTHYSPEEMEQHNQYIEGLINMCDSIIDSIELSENKDLGRLICESDGFVWVDITTSAQPIYNSEAIEIYAVMPNEVHWLIDSQEELEKAIKNEAKICIEGGFINNNKTRLIQALQEYDGSDFVVNDQLIEFIQEHI